MKRREFISRGIGAAAFTGAVLTLPGYAKILAGGPGSLPAAAYDIVAIRGGEPGPMFDQAIAAMGGMSAFVKKGQTVVIKPNIGWDVTPERAGNTNPQLVRRVIEHCFQAGARQVYVFDNTCDKWDRCYANSGIEKAVKDAGGTVVPGNTEGYYHEVQVPSGIKLKTAKVHELILESDVFINIPILKNHGSAKLTMTMKNLMGVVWDRGYWHRNDLHQCIADYATFSKKPQLNIIDAYRAMMKNGPRGITEADVTLFKSMILSTDMVAADTAAARLFGTDPGEVPYIGFAEAQGVGTMDLDRLNIHRIIL